jgi:hypothetical protein
MKGLEKSFENLDEIDSYVKIYLDLIFDIKRGRASKRGSFSSVAKAILIVSVCLKIVFKIISVSVLSLIMRIQSLEKLLKKLSTSHSAEALSRAFDAIQNIGKHSAKTL